MSARMRSIWPDFFSNADLAGLGPLHRLLYAGLPTACDWKGRGDDKPGDLKIRFLPLDAIDAAGVDAIMADLASIGLLVRYQVDGKRYFQIGDDWKKQHPHVDEKKKPSPRPERGSTISVEPPALTESETGAAPGEPGATTGQAPGSHKAGTGQTPVQHGYLLSLVTVSDPLSLEEERDPAASAASTSGQQSLLAEPEISPIQRRMQEVHEVFDHWKRVRNKRADVILSTGRESKIRARLKERYTVAQLCEAIDHVQYDDWKERPKNDDLTVLLKDSPQVDRFLAMQPGKTARGASIQITADAKAEHSVAGRKML